MKIKLHLLLYGPREEFQVVDIARMLLQTPVQRGLKMSVESISTEMSTESYFPKQFLCVAAEIR